MSTDLSPPGLRVWRDRKLIWEHGDSVRYLIIRITGGRVRPASAGTGARHDVALVLHTADLGEPLSGLAFDIAGGLVRRFSSGDRISVILPGVDGPVATEIDPGSGDLDDLDDLADRADIDRSGISGPGVIDLWLAGVRALAARSNDLSEATRRVIVLSGTRSPGDDPWETPELSGYARRFEAAGIPTTSVGLGPDVDIARLASIDQDFGRWTLPDASIQRLDEILVARYLSLTPVVAEDVRIDLDFPRRVKGQFIGQDAIASQVFGTVRQGAEEYLVARLKFPPGKPGRTIPVNVSMSWQAPSRAGGRQQAKEVVTYTFATGRENTPQTRDDYATPISAMAWFQDILASVLEANSDRDYERAEEIIDRELRYFQRYCRGVPGGAARILGKGLAIGHAPWQRRQQVS